MHQRFKVCHILLQHKYQAEDVLKRLEQGLSFSEAAQKYSICVSSKAGGELGDFRRSRFHEDFSEAVEKLSEGKVSQPVRTPFGYHLILKVHTS